uniref:Uncharacterized protein n=1 Tax=Cacopsylla melanoneura TaxID=428564 RepID=A0A8D8RD38_9HEMI
MKVIERCAKISSNNTVRKIVLETLSAAMLFAPALSISCLYTVFMLFSFLLTIRFSFHAIIIIIILYHFVEELFCLIDSLLASRNNSIFDMNVVECVTFFFSFLHLGSRYYIIVVRPDKKQTVRRFCSV